MEAITTDCTAGQECSSKLKFNKKREHVFCIISYITVMKKEKKRCQKILSRFFRDANHSVTNRTRMRLTMLFPFVNLPESTCIGFSHSAFICHHIQNTKDRAPEINTSGCELQCWGSCGYHCRCLLSCSEGNCQHAECSILNCLGFIYDSLSGRTLRHYKAKHCHT